MKVEVAVPSSPRGLCGRKAISEEEEEKEEEEEEKHVLWRRPGTPAV